MDPLWALDAWEAAELVRSKQLRAVDLLDTALERIGRFDGELNAFVCIDPDEARSQAEAVDAAIERGEDPGPLAGVPTGVKDLENARGFPTKRGSLLFDGEPAPLDSTQVSRLRAAGAVIVGKTATPEMGSVNYTASKATGVTRNPWDTTTTPGGSSGGSAAALVSGMVALTTGSDGGGSIRIPASFTGLPGLKVTYGLVARGPGRLASANLSVHGPMARSVRDVARALDQVAGVHPMDPFSLPKPHDSYEQLLDLDLSGATVAWSSDLGFGVCDTEVESIARAAAERLIEAGRMQEIDIPVELPDVGSSWSAAWATDCFSELEAFWPDRGDEMTPVVALAMQLAETLQPGQIAAAARGRYELLRLVNEAFEKVDFILTPTTPTTAFTAEGPAPSEIGGVALSNPLLAICFTYPFNLTGHPAMSMPAGLTSSGLPVGLQMVGPRLSEARLLAAARILEQAAPTAKIAPDYT